MQKVTSLWLLPKCVVVAWLTASCASIETATLNQSPSGTVKVFMTHKPDQPYVEMKYIQATGALFHGPEYLLKSLIKRAEREGADAIIEVRYDFQHWWPVASGVAVKFEGR